MAQFTDKPSSDQLEFQRRLLSALSSDLSLPLLQIKSELESNKLSRELMSASVESGLKLIEAYQVALRTGVDSSFELEPVIIGSLLNEVAEDLSDYAAAYDTDIKVDVTGRFAPVLAHKASLRTALECLASSIIRAQSSQTKRKSYQVLLGAHRIEHDAVTAGVFSQTKGLSDLNLRVARQMTGRAGQPFPDLPAGSASGVLIADLLCATICQPLRQAAHRNLSGLATVLPVTSQLQFMQVNV